MAVILIELGPLKNLIKKAIQKASPSPGVEGNGFRLVRGLGKGPDSAQSHDLIHRVFGLGILFLFLASGLFLFQRVRFQEWVKASNAPLFRMNEQTQSLFKGSFYFFFQEQFLPESNKLYRGFAEDVRGSGLKQVRIFARDASLEWQTVFDSASATPNQAKALSRKLFESEKPFVREGVESGEFKRTGLFKRDVIFVMPPAQPGQTPLFFVYRVESNHENTIFLITCLGSVLVFLFGVFLTKSGFFKAVQFRFREKVRKYWKIKAKFLTAIFAITVLTALILFVSLSSLQTRELTQKLEKESRLFGQFSTLQVVNDFKNFFYFYYSERFLPEIKRILVSNENLLRIRIVAVKSQNVLFDTESSVLRGSEPDRSAVNPERENLDWSEELKSELSSKGSAASSRDWQGQKTYLFVNTYINENQEAQFWVEYTFSYQSLKDAVARIRRQIVLDLIPSLVLGLLIAVAFAQVLVKPIRRLVQALQKVAEGDYEVSVSSTQTDEIGDLVSAFNAMTLELRRKKELRKYLSDSTYRQIVQAVEKAEGADGARMQGVRLDATILFCDIRSFVSHCENLEAEEITEMLNEYFSEMVEVIHRHGGEVDKFIGDALLAVFYPDAEARVPGASQRSKDSALQAIYCALSMRERLGEYNKRRVALQKAPLEIGIGITFGEVISGPIGAKERMDFTVIGDVVNLASRIEKFSKQGRHTRVVFSDRVEERVRFLLDYERLNVGPVQGKEEEVNVFELIGVKDLKELSLSLQSDDVAIRCRSIEILGESRNPEAIDLMIGLLQGNQESVRIAACLALGKLCPKNHSEGVSALFELLGRERVDKVVSAAIAVLGRICNTERLLDLVGFLEVSDERIVANTIETLSVLRTHRANDILIQKLGSKNNRVKANAAMALFASGKLEVIDTIKPMLLHSDPMMRSSAAFAIGELTMISAQDWLADRFKQDPSSIKQFLAELQECVPLLVSILKDADPHVRRQAVIALGKIRDRSAVLPMIDMIQPASESRELLQDITNALRSIGSHRLVREVITRLSGG